jgi:hypothetical protein
MHAWPPKGNGRSGTHADPASHATSVEAQPTPTLPHTMGGTAATPPLGAHVPRPVCDAGVPTEKLSIGICWQVKHPLAFCGVHGNAMLQLGAQKS